jgi:hypothetical protein
VVVLQAPMQQQLLRQHLALAVLAVEHRVVVLLQQVKVVFLTLEHP